MGDDRCTPPFDRCTPSFYTCTPPHNLRRPIQSRDIALQACVARRSDGYIGHFFVFGIYILE